MAQTREQIDLPTSLGYLLKEASSALRAAMEQALQPLGMTVTHYSCLELLAQRPGLTNSDLARGTFVTRQSMNVLLHTLERDGYVTRAPASASGRSIPTSLTAFGEAERAKASTAVRSVEARMTAGMSEREREMAFDLLARMTGALR